MRFLGSPKLQELREIKNRNSNTRFIDKNDFHPILSYPDFLWNHILSSENVEKIT